MSRCRSSLPTAAVALDLFVEELKAAGLSVIPPRSIAPPLPVGADACDEISCALALGARHGAERIIYGSLSKLGDKIVARVSGIRPGEETPSYSDRISAMTVEDLDVVMSRVAEGIGVQAGILSPTGDSYGGADRLTDLRAVFKYEASQFLLTTTTVAGFTWGDGQFEWTMLDVFGGPVFGKGDVGAYVGGGLGLHMLHVEGQPIEKTHGEPPYQYTWLETPEQNATALTADLGVGLLLLRTYSFHIVVDLRYHHVFEEFEEVEAPEKPGKGASGFRLTFGTSH